MKRDDFQKRIAELQSSKKHNVSDTRIISANIRSNDPKWIEANNRRREDPNYDKKVGKLISETYSTPQGKKKQSIKALGRVMSDEQKAHLVELRLNDPPRSKETRKKIGLAQIGNKKRCKQIQTPIGLFDSLNAAGEAYEALGRGNAIKHIRKWTKTDPNNFYFIKKGII